MKSTRPVGAEAETCSFNLATVCPKHACALAVVDVVVVAVAVAGSWRDKCTSFRTAVVQPPKPSTSNTTTTTTSTTTTSL